MSWGDYESSSVQALRKINSANYNKDFVSNIQSLNYATDFMADYMIVMQKGVDDANKNILQKIQDFIEDLIIIFGGGGTGDSGFEWGDLGYIIGAIGSLFGFSGVSGPINLLNAAQHFLENFLAPLEALGNIINGFIQAIFQFFAGLLSNVPIIGSTLHDIVTNIAGGINTTNTTANTAVTNAATAQTSADTAAIIGTSAGSQVQVVIDGLVLQPYWMTLNLTEESSFPRILLMQQAWEVNGSGGQPSAWWNVYTASNDGYVFAVRNVPGYIPPINYLEGCFIRALYSGKRSVVTYIPDVVNSGSPCELYIVVGRMLANGNINIEWVSPNQTPLITNARFERRVTITSDILFSTGETMFVGVHQRGTGSPRSLLGITQSSIPAAVTVYPGGIKGRFSYSSVFAVGNVLSSAAISFSDTNTPFISIGKALSTTLSKLAFYDDFNNVLSAYWARANSSGTGGAATGGGNFAVSDGTDGVRIYLYSNPMNYDDVIVSGAVVSPSGRWQRLYGRFAPDGSNGIALSITSSQIYIDRVTAGPTFTSLAGGSYGTVTTNLQLRLVLTGNVFKCQYYNTSTNAWTDLFSYTDTGNVIPKDSGHRLCGVGVERFSFANSGGWDWWKAEDQ